MMFEEKGRKLSCWRVANWGQARPIETKSWTNSINPWDDNDKSSVQVSIPFPLPSNVYIGRRSGNTSKACPPTDEDLISATSATVSAVSSSRERKKSWGTIPLSPNIPQWKKSLIFKVGFGWIDGDVLLLKHFHPICVLFGLISVLLWIKVAN